MAASIAKRNCQAEELDLDAKMAATGLPVSGSLTSSGVTRPAGSRPGSLVEARDHRDILHGADAAVHWRSS